MGRYRRRPSDIEAVQFDGTNWVEMVGFTGVRQLEDGRTVPVFNRAGTFLISFIGRTEKQVGELWVEANGAHVYIELGEWVAKDEKGFYPIKDDMFQKLYERLED
jgi:hypothetical protein